jgi:hypothetical protein
MARPKGSYQKKCHRGHLLNKSNLYLTGGKRRCRKCFKLFERMYYYRDMEKKTEKRLGVK